jgi:hypothetical protein
MEAGTLTMTFSEIMKIGSFDISEFNLRLNPSEASSFSDFSLSAHKLTDISAVVVTETPSNIVTVELVDEQNLLELNPYIATSLESTWITSSWCTWNGACPYRISNVTDMAGNPFPGVDWTDPIIADFFLPSSTSPDLVSFDLNLDSGHIDLTFSRPVTASLIDATHMCLQKWPCGEFVGSIRESHSRRQDLPRSAYAGQRICPGHNRAYFGRTPCRLFSFTSEPVNADAIAWDQFQFPVLPQCDWGY